jgi:hypothetical protein
LETPEYPEADSIMASDLQWCWQKIVVELILELGEFAGK